MRMAKRGPIGPDPQQSFTYEELPIGSTIVGIDPDAAQTGSWRFYRPIFAWGIAPCQEACPAGVDVRGFISHMRKKHFEEAWLRYMEENPFPAICGRVCMHPCESQCNRKNLDSAVSIRALERFISDFHQALPFVSDPERERRGIAIAGSGPSGLSCAYFLTRLGYRTTLFETEDQMGGKLREIPEYLLPREVMDQEIRTILKHGVTVRLGNLDWEGLEKFEAIYLDTTLIVGQPSSNSGGKIWLNPGGETDRRGVFAGSEATSDSQSFVEAIGKGKRGAIAIDLYLRGKDLFDELGGLILGEKGRLSFEHYRNGCKRSGNKKRVVPYSDLNPSLLSRKPPGEISYCTIEIGQGRSERIELTMTCSQAIEEAFRCLGCGACNSCGRCLLYCPEGAISRHASLPHTMEIDYAFCKGCGICRNECPRGLYWLKKEEGDWK